MKLKGKIFLIVALTCLICTPAVAGKGGGGQKMMYKNAGGNGSMNHYQNQNRYQNQNSLNGSGSMNRYQNQQGGNVSGSGSGNQTQTRQQLYTPGSQLPVTSDSATLQ